jgi:hypothetical protein
LPERPTRSRADVECSDMVFSMHLIDWMAVTLLFLGTVAVALGQTALSRGDDFEALYWLFAGLLGVAAAVQITRPGKA